MPHPRFIIMVSRPRFWLYLFGPFLIGLAAAAVNRTDFLRLDTLIFGLYFLLPANLLIYGVNDIFDYETDKINPKKEAYEKLVRPEMHWHLFLTILLLNVPFLVAAALLTPDAFPAIIGFLFFSIFYSAPPIRAKSKPFLDSAFNILYIFPAIFAYKFLSGAYPPFPVIAAGGLWTMAMHAYSAIPDIEADREARLNTIATWLGKNGTLIFCLVMYLASAALAFKYLGFLSVALGAVYSIMIIISLLSAESRGVFPIYKIFPMLNAVTGFFLFWFVFIINLR